MIIFWLKLGRLRCRLRHLGSSGIFDRGRELDLPQELEGDTVHGMEASGRRASHHRRRQNRLQGRKDFRQAARKPHHQPRHESSVQQFVKKISTVIVQSGDFAYHKAMKYK